MKSGLALASLASRLPRWFLGVGLAAHRRINSVHRMLKAMAMIIGIFIKQNRASYPLW